jgi:hypothetical protein
MRFNGVFLPREYNMGQDDNPLSVLKNIYLFLLQKFESSHAHTTFFYLWFILIHLSLLCWFSNASVNCHICPYL